MNDTIPLKLTNKRDFLHSPFCHAKSAKKTLTCLVDKLAFFYVKD